MNTHSYYSVRLLSGSQSARSSGAETDKEDEVLVQGYHLSLWRSLLTCAACLMTGGVLLLVLYWKQDWALRITHKNCPVFLADRLMISDKFNRSYVVVVRMMKLNKNGNLITKPFRTDSGKNMKHENESINVLMDNLGQSKWIINQITNKGYVVFFKFKKLRYFWHDEKCEFQKISGLDEDVSTSFLINSKPLSDNEAEFRTCLFGYNSIHIKVPWITTILVKEALTPFFIFQAFSVILWLTSEYTTYAISIIVMVTLSLTLTVYTTRTSRVKLQRMIEKELLEHVKIVRQHDYFHAKCKHLVPGDIIEIVPEGQPMLCDAVLIDGVCILDESMLTGESVPVTKIALPYNRDSTLFNVKTHSKSTLLRGTRVLQARSVAGFSYKDRPVRAVVIRTGWQTSKGALLQAILFPKPFDFRLEKDSYKFVASIALLVLAGMIYSIVVLSRLGTAASQVVIRTLDIVTIGVPPILPASLSIGIFFALRRLKHLNIFCISPRSINMSGDVDTVVFDKTGTLTQDGLTIKCILPSQDGEFKEEIHTCEEDTMSLPLVHGMAACHSMNIINGKMFGDSVDMAMFNFTNWSMTDQDSAKTVRPKLATKKSNSNVEIRILQIYPFESSLQRQSIIVKYKDDEFNKLFVKGSPEMIASLCKQNTLPTNFKEIFLHFAKEGYRILGMASKILSINYDQVQTIPREEIEHHLSFEGLIICENKIKCETPSVISHLRQANIRPLMATGDNILTALNVARSCNFFDFNAQVYLVEWNNDENHLSYSLLDEANTKEKQTSLINFEQSKNIFRQRYYFAMTGATWEMVREKEPRLLQRLVVMGVVFARMASYQKAQLVEAIQEMKCKVAMCGDGTNDCEALRAANTGVSLSKAEASIACAFTAQKGNIGAIIDVIREGRCALVTSFGLFQYLMCYSVLQFSCCIILYWIGSNLTNGQFLYADLAIVLPLSITFGMSSANPSLNRRKPSIRLLSVHNVIVILFYICVNFGCLILAFLLIRSQSWFYPFVKVDSAFVMSLEGTAVFTVSVFQFITLAAVFAQGLPFRKPMFTNCIFIGNLLLISCITLALFISENSDVQEFFEFMPIPSLKFKIFLFAIALCTALICFIFDFIINKTILLSWISQTPTRQFDRIVQEIKMDDQWPPSKEENLQQLTSAEIFNEEKNNAGFQ